MRFNLQKIKLQKLIVNQITPTTSLFQQSMVVTCRKLATIKTHVIGTTSAVSLAVAEEDRVTRSVKVEASRVDQTTSTIASLLAIISQEDATIMMIVNRIREDVNLEARVASLTEARNADQEETVMNRAVMKEEAEAANQIEEKVAIQRVASPEAIQ